MHQTWTGDLFHILFSSVQFSSVAQSCPTLCNSMNHSTSGLPVHHQLPEFTQIHVHWVSDAIQPSHPWSSPSPPAPYLSQHLLSKCPANECSTFLHHNPLSVDWLCCTLGKWIRVWFGNIIWSIILSKIPFYVSTGLSLRWECQHLLDIQESNKVSEKHLFLLYWLCQSLWLCASQ